MACGLVSRSTAIPHDELEVRALVVHPEHDTVVPLGCAEAYARERLGDTPGVTRWRMRRDATRTS